MINRIFRRSKTKKGDAAITSPPSTLTPVPAAPIRQGQRLPQQPPTRPGTAGTGPAPPSALRPASYPPQQQSPYVGVQRPQPPAQAVAPPVRMQQPPLPTTSLDAMAHTNGEEEAPRQATIANGGNATEVTRELVKKFIADIWNRGELDLIPDVVSPSLRFNGCVSVASCYSCFLEY